MAPENPSTSHPKSAAWATRVKRKEDPRFIRGKGNYVDDIKLPGMLYMDIVRSPYAHAKIMNIDTAKALDIPGVLAVITGEDLDKYNLALDADADVGHADGAADRQGDVPGAGGRGGHRDRPLHRGRRRRRGRGRVRAAAGRRRPVRRRWSPARPCCAPTRRTRRTTTSGTGRRATGPRPTRRSPRPTVVVKQDIYIPRIHVASIETCGCVAQLRQGHRQADGLDDDAGAARDPHRLRARRGHSGFEEHKIRIISPDIGGGFGGKVPVYPGLRDRRRRRRSSPASR